MNLYHYFDNEPGSGRIDSPFAIYYSPWSGRYKHMFKAVLIPFLILNFSFAFAQSGKRIYLTKGADNGIFLGEKMASPGDTFVLKPAGNPYTYIYIGGVKGTKQAPIVLINEGDEIILTSGIDIEHSEYVKVTGSGAKKKYGFRIQHSNQTALAIRGRSDNIEVERFYVTDAMFGCWVKNEANCDSSINNWVLHDISIHDYEMHDIKIEGFYMGSTDPDNVSRPINCNGTQQFYKPSKLGNIKVYNGIIDGTGRPAILLCNAAYGMSEIYNNVVSNVGREYNDQQGTGIVIGTYTRAYIHHNTVKNTYTWGIASLGGSGLVRIENNRIDSSGYLEGKTLPWPQNILIDTRPTTPVDSTRFIIANNIVSHPASNAENIYVGRTVNSFAVGNVVCNNSKSARIYVDKRISWSDCNGIQKTSGGIDNKMIFIGFGSLCLLGIIYFFYQRGR
jgi:hypothetical protein